MSESSLDALFSIAVSRIIDEEGGLVNDPRDPGSVTKYGISARSYPNEDIPNLTVDAAKALYKRDYWDPLATYQIPDKLRVLAFEAAVNQGLSRVKGWLDQAKGQVSWFMAERAIAYTELQTFKVFGKGWLRRLFKEVEDIG